MILDFRKIFNRILDLINVNVVEQTIFIIKHYINIKNQKIINYYFLLVNLKLK